MSTIHINTELVEGTKISRVTMLRPGERGSIVTLVAKKGDRYHFSTQKHGKVTEKIRLKRAGSDLVVILEGTGTVLHALLIPDYYPELKAKCSSLCRGGCDQPGFSFIAAEEYNENAVRYVNHADATQTHRPTLVGMGPADALISLYDNNALLGSTQVSTGGIWRFTPADDLAERLHTFTAVISTPAGEFRSQDIFTLFIEPDFSREPVIIHSMENIAPDISDPQNELRDSYYYPVLYGTAEPKSMIKVFYRQAHGIWITANEDIRVNSTGEWTWIAPALSAELPWEFRACNGEVDSTLTRD